MSECTHQWAHFFPSSSLFFCNQVLKHFPGSLALHVRYATVYCLYKSQEKDRKGGMCSWDRWERHLLTVEEFWLWERVPQTLTLEKKKKTNSRKWGTQIKTPATELSQFDYIEALKHSRGLQSAVKGTQKGIWQALVKWHWQKKGAQVTQVLVKYV